MKKIDQKNITSTINLTFEHGEKVSKAKVRHVWHQLYSKETLPKVIALIVSKEEFFVFRNKVREHNIKCGAPNHIEACSIKEWGEVVEGGACVIKTKKGYLVLIRNDSSYSLEEELKHELIHIHNGDVEPK